MRIFGRDYDNLDEAHLQDLRHLEHEGAIYGQFWREDPGASGFCRIRFRPGELVEYVNAMTCYDDFLRWCTEGLEAEEALKRVGDWRIRDRVLSYNEWARSIGQDTAFCPAAFLGPALETLVCGGEPDRYEFLSGSYTADRRFLILEILEAFSESSKSVTSRSKGQTNYELRNERDVQDLLFMAIRSIFPDARVEEWTRKHAGTSKRIDIVVPGASTLIEIKIVRDAAHAKSVADELRIDFEAYHAHADCGRLIAFVWDPQRWIPDRHSFVEDLRGLRVKGDSQFEVDVLVKP